MSNKAMIDDYGFKSIGHDLFGGSLTTFRRNNDIIR